MKYLLLLFTLQAFAADEPFQELPSDSDIIDVLPIEQAPKAKPGKIKFMPKGSKGAKYTGPKLPVCEVTKTPRMCIPKHDTACFCFGNSK